MEKGFYNMTKDFKQLLKEMYDKVRSTPEGEKAYQKQKKLEEESQEEFFQSLKKRKKDIHNVK